MLPLPWTTGTEATGTAGGLGNAPTPDQIVVMASRLELRGRRDVPAFLLASLRLRRAFRSAPGGVGLALAAEPGRRTFWTLSAWRDQASLNGFNRSPLHRTVVDRFRARMQGSTFTTWHAAPGDLPLEWPEVRARLAAAEANRRETTEVPAN